MTRPTEQEILRQIRVSEIGEPHYFGPQARPPQPGNWLYRFGIEVGTETYIFTVSVEESVPDGDREANAVEQFKDIVSLIAKKVAAYRTRSL